MILLIAIFLTPETIKSNPTLNKMFMGIRPAVVALIIAPVITTARAAKISWKTIFIPVGVALLIWSKIPYISNPIIYIILGGIGGYIWYTRNQLNKVNRQRKEADKQ
jgi:chromate transporter